MNSVGHNASMIAVAPLQTRDRGTWETLFAGYNAFYNRTWPAERYEGGLASIPARGSGSTLSADGWTAAWRA
jgi:hypothetical protein